MEAREIFDSLGEWAESQQDHATPAQICCMLIFTAIDLAFEYGSSKEESEELIREIVEKSLCEQLKEE